VLGEEVGEANGLQAWSSKQLLPESCRSKRRADYDDGHLGARCQSNHRVLQVGSSRPFNGTTRSWAASSRGSYRELAGKGERERGRRYSDAANRRQPRQHGYLQAFVASSSMLRPWHQVCAHPGDQQRRVNMSPLPYSGKP